MKYAPSYGNRAADILLECMEKTRDDVVAKNRTYCPMEQCNSIAAMARALCELAGSGLLDDSPAG